VDDGGKFIYFSLALHGKKGIIYIPLSKRHIYIRKSENGIGTCRTGFLLPLHKNTYHNTRGVLSFIAVQIISEWIRERAWNECFSTFLGFSPSLTKYNLYYSILSIKNTHNRHFRFFRFLK
jgi:hypothetical protein